MSHECKACGCGSSTRPLTAPPRSDVHEHDDDGHGHQHDHHDHEGLPGWPRLLTALALACAAELLHFIAPDRQGWQWAGMALAAVAIGLAGLGIYKNGLASLLRGQLGINALMTVAVTGAFAIGQWPEAAMVMALYAVAELIEERASERARNAVTGLMALAPDQAEVRAADGQWQAQPAAQVVLGATVRVRPGARVPLDGVVLEGHSAIDQAPVTGESIPVEKGPGDAVFAGTINTSGELHVRVTAAAGNTTLDRIIHAVEQAQATRAPIQRFVDRFAAIYTPTVFVLALALALLAPLLLGWPWLAALYKALVLLVIACPCALVISTPVTVVSALTAAARRGIVVKGGVFLENARRLKAVALDKTGTITIGKPALVAWQIWQQGTEPDWAARTAASLAAHSDHPVSRAIAAGWTGPHVPVDDFQAQAGRGVQGNVAGEALVLGNHRWIEERQQCSGALETLLDEHGRQGRSVTLLAGNQGVLAVFAVADTVKPGARAAVDALKALGVTPVLLSGDNPAIVQAVAADAGITEARGNLLPEHKLTAIAELQRSHGPTGMAGDGINDAPALARADVGFAMGGAGTDVAMETADVVIMNDDLGRIAETISLSRRAHAVLWQNIALALGIKVVFFALALTGQASMWMAVFADMGASLLVVGNGLRLLRAPAD